MCDLLDHVTGARLSWTNKETRSGHARTHFVQATQKLSLTSLVQCTVNTGAFYPCHLHQLPHKKSEQEIEQQELEPEYVTSLSYFSHVLQLGNFAVCILWNRTNTSENNRNQTLLSANSFTHTCITLIIAKKRKCH